MIESPGKGLRTLKRTENSPSKPAKYDFGSIATSVSPPTSYSKLNSTTVGSALPGANRDIRYTIELATDGFGTFDTEMFVGTPPGMASAPRYCSTSRKPSSIDRTQSEDAESSSRLFAG